MCDTVTFMKILIDNKCLNVLSMQKNKHVHNRCVFACDSTWEEFKAYLLDRTIIPCFL